MADETTQFIVADAALDAAGQPRRTRRFFRRRKNEPPPLTHCENCGALLTGQYCSQCGQHAIDYRRSFLAVILDAADSFFNWDTKFLKSIAVLIIKPWKLTNDFNAGRRARYVHPLRLYLLASIAFFLLARLVSFNPSDVVQFDLKDRAQLDVALAKLSAPQSGLNEAERAKVEEARAKLSALGDTNLSAPDKQRMQTALGTLIAASMREKFREKDHARLNKALDRLNAPPPSPSPSVAASPGGKPAAAESETAPTMIPSTAASPSPPPPRGIHFNVDPPAAEQPGGIQIFNNPDEKKEPFERWLETRIKDKVGEGGTKSKLFLETLRSNIPTMMLCCIPLFALVLKLLYIRKGRFYIEHLVYSLHIHSFAYIAAVVITLLAMALGRWSPVAKGLEIGFLSAAAVVLVFLSIRRVYGQSWFFTAFKFWLGGLVYFFILVFAIAATAFATLLLPG